MSEQSLTLRKIDSQEIQKQEKEISPQENVSNGIKKFENEFNVEYLLPTAGKIELSERESEILFAPVNEEDIEIRPDGFIYLPWMEYARRLTEAFGIAWALIPNGMPKFHKVTNHIYWGFWLVIKGHLCGYAIGEQEYITSNRNMTYGDACEGAKSNALMRLCKGIGMSLELWKPSFIRKWKEKYAEKYWDEGKGKYLWRKKGEIIEEPLTEEQEEPKKATQKQIKMIFAKLRSLNMSKEKMKEFCEAITGKPSSRDWTNDDIQRLLEEIEEASIKETERETVNCPDKNIAVNVLFCNSQCQKREGCPAFD
jgi:hypothetical protein